MKKRVQKMETPALVPSREAEESDTRRIHERRSNNEHQAFKVKAEQKLSVARPRATLEGNIEMNLTDKAWENMVEYLQWANSVA
jgi:hypothetical protein